MSIEALSLNSSINSLVDENLFVGEIETEEMLFQRLSPYTTLRPNDLARLLTHTSLNLNRKAIATSFEEPIEEVQSDEEQPEPEISEDVIVRGQDIGDLPAEYHVKGLHTNEMPVIGVYVDPRIVPGFSYVIRKLGTDEYLFDGRPLKLQSVGLGYGKRITFAGDTKNFNDNYFWSDSHPKGFGFSLVGVQAGDEMSIYGCNGSGVVGEVKVERLIGCQEELSSEIVNGDVIKRAQVTLECSIFYYKRHHGVFGALVQDLEKVGGEAVIIKKKNSRQAVLDCIHHVTLSCAPGLNTLQVEP